MKGGPLRVVGSPLFTIAKTDVGPNSMPRKPEPEPVPEGYVRCKCGRVVRAKADGMPFAHNRCPHAPSKESRSLVLCDCHGDTPRECARRKRVGI